MGKPWENEGLTSGKNLHNYGNSGKNHQATSLLGIPRAGPMGFPMTQHLPKLLMSTGCELENGHICPLNMVIFHSYVNVYQRVNVLHWIDPLEKKSHQNEILAWTVDNDSNVSSTLFHREKHPKKTFVILFYCLVEKGF